MELTDIDGSQLEGGGQILRVSMSLACLLNKSIHIHSIRAGRSPPGLAAQHLSGVLLVEQISDGAKLQGKEKGSTELTFRPGTRLQSTRFYEDCGTAGSITLMIQIALPCIAFPSSASMVDRSAQPASKRISVNDSGVTTTANEQVRIVVELVGGTNVSTSPPIDHCKHVLLPLLACLFGLHGSITIHQRGYYPKGGGRALLSVTPVNTLQSFRLTEQGALTSLHGCVFGYDNQTNKLIVMRKLVELFGANPLQAADGSLVSEILFWDSETSSHVIDISSTATSTIADTFNASNHFCTQTGEFSSPPKHLVKEGKSYDKRNYHSGDKDRGRGQDRGGSSPVVGLGVQLWAHTSSGAILSSNGYLDTKANKGPLDAVAIHGLAMRVVESLRVVAISGACVDEYTADQLLVFMSLASGRSELLVEPPGDHSSLHMATVMKIAAQLLPTQFAVTSATDVSEVSTAVENSTILVGNGRSNSRCRLITCQGGGFNTLNSNEF